jgi:hypothetical protein|tara:strand:- start:435 stop:713 length:279 start_codon:yes stop_codon:yes gene_type:complete
MVREFPSFELNSEEFPELELEMLQVYNAGSLNERQNALDALEHKMHHTQPANQPRRGETIFQLVAPDKYVQSKVYTVGDEDTGYFQVSGEEG